MSHELVSAEGVFAMIRRLYTGNVREVMSELFQNAQRAGASIVDMYERGEDRNFEIEIRDNGCGVGAEDGDCVEGFRKLLTIGSSGFDSTVLLNQHPMGVGFYSLLTLEGVSSVRIESNGRKLTIEPVRWFDDKEYRESWYCRLESGDTFKDGENGTSVSFIANEQVRATFRKAFNPLENAREETPASGYEGVLKVFLNGLAQDTGTPSGLRPKRVFLETRYKGNKVRIGFLAGNIQSYVNWHGQLVPANFGINLGIELVVRKGRPLTPMSPSRRGFVNDDKATEFNAFLQRTVTNFFTKEKFQSKWTPSLLKEAFEAVPALAKISPCFVAEVIQSDTEIAAEHKLLSDGLRCAAKGQDVTSIEEVDQEMTKGAVVLCKQGKELVLTDRFDAVIEGHSYAKEIGMETFLDAVREVKGPAYRAIAGKPDHLTKLIWKTGQSVCRQSGVIVCQPGEFALVPKKGSIENIEWHPLTGRTVLGIGSTTATDIAYTDLVIGTEGDLKQVVDLIEARAEEWFEWDESSDDGYSTCSDQYWESVGEFVRKLIGNTIKQDFSVMEVLSAANASSPIESITFKRGEQTANPSLWSLVSEPTGIDVRFVDGTVRSFSLR